MNLRVASNVFRSAVYTNEQVSREYLSGILASSNSAGGQDDSMIYYLDIVNSLSSHQLRLHYMMYRALNELLASNPDIQVNLSRSDDMGKAKLYTDGMRLRERGIDLERDFVALYAKGLFKSYKFQSKAGTKQGRVIPMIDTHIIPSTLGFQLYGVACNRFADWRNVNNQVFNNLPDIETLDEKLLNKSYVDQFTGTSGTPPTGA